MKPPKTKPNAFDAGQIKFLVDRRYTVQEHRIAIGNQISAMEKEGKTTDSLEYFFERFQELEKELDRYLAKAVKAHPMWPWFKAQKGIGPVFASALLSSIDIRKAEHCSSVWMYCGLAVDLDTGKAMRRKKGEKICWNPFLKKTCFLIGESFVKVKGKWRTIYDTSREFYERKFPEEVKQGKYVLYTKGHKHAMAKRRTVKLFTAAMWEEWRKQEGLPVSVPFAHRGLEGQKA